MKHLFVAVIFAILVLLPASALSEPSAGGAGCVPDWVEYAVTDVTDTAVNSMIGGGPGFFAAYGLAFDEDEMPRVGSVGGLAKFEWTDGLTTEVDIQHLGATAKYTISYSITASNNQAAQTGYVYIAVTEDDDEAAYADSLFASHARVYMHTANTARMFIGEVSGVTLTPNSRISIILVNWTTSAQTLTTIQGTTLKFVAESC